MQIQKLSTSHHVRTLTPDDITMIYELAKQNTLFYQHCPPMVSYQSIAEDLKALPPNTTYDDKYFLGFFQDDVLIAIMDLIFNYPDRHTAFIGLFMVAKKSQNKGIGSNIIRETCDFIKQAGYDRIRLGYVKTNLQSKAFWQKNGFLPTGCESRQPQYTIVIMQKELNK